MIKKPLIATIVNWMAIMLGLSIFLLALLGKVEFGHGLGDLIYIVVLGLLVIIHVVINLPISKLGKTRKTWLVACAFVMAYGYFAFKISYGRGPEKSWNGELWTQNRQTPSLGVATLQLNN